MPRFMLLVSLLVACGSPQRPAPAPAPAPTPTPSPATPPAPAPAAAALPKIDIIVWSEYQDFSGHGMKGQGRFYRHDATGWLAASCHTSHIADPEAGPQPQPTTCGPWAAVAPAQITTLEGLQRPGYDHVEVRCDRQPDVCKALDVSSK